MSLDRYDLLNYMVRLLIIFLILPLHEYAHAWVAHKLGDDTAAYQGRLTLNPIAHIDPVGAIALLLTGYGWAKPVPIDPLRFRRKYSMRGGMALTAAAGPISNLLAALVGMIILQCYTCTGYYLESLASSGTTGLTPPTILYLFLYWFVSINIGLAVFNLVPVPPLDGSKVLFFFLGSKANPLISWMNRNSYVVQVVFLIIVVSGVLSIPLGIIRNGIMTFYFWITSWIPALLA